MERYRVGLRQRADVIGAAVAARRGAAERSGQWRRGRGAARAAARGGRRVVAPAARRHRAACAGAARLAAGHADLHLQVRLQSLQYRRVGAGHH